jgi:hypothetical protein
MVFQDFVLSFFKQLPLLDQGVLLLLSLLHVIWQLTHGNNHLSLSLLLVMYGQLMRNLIHLVEIDVPSVSAVTFVQESAAL